MPTREPVIPLVAQYIATRYLSPRVARSSVISSLRLYDGTEGNGVKSYNV